MELFIVIVIALGVMALLVFGGKFYDEHQKRQVIRFNDTFEGIVNGAAIKHGWKHVGHLDSYWPSDAKEAMKYVDTLEAVVGELEAAMVCFGKTSKMYKRLSSEKFALQRHIRLIEVVKMHPDLSELGAKRVVNTPPKEFKIPRDNQPHRHVGSSARVNHDRRRDDDDFAVGFAAQAGYQHVVMDTPSSSRSYDDSPSRCVDSTPSRSYDYDSGSSYSSGSDSGGGSCGGGGGD